MSYNKAQDALIKAFKDSVTIDKKALYLFFIKENTTHSDIKGHMPFNRQFGFIYAANQSITEITHTMAHELGHGAFRLKHTFSNENNFIQDQGQTPNLMDYASGSELLKYQWDECHDFDLGCNWFEDGDEGAILDENSCFKIESNRTKYKIVIKYQLSKVSLFKTVYDYINEKGITYCIGDNDVDLCSAGITTNISLETKSGKIDFNTVRKDVNNINPIVIFHEFNHAAQWIYDYKTNNHFYENEARLEVETRIIVLFAYYKMAPMSVQNDYDAFHEYVKTFFKKAEWDYEPLFGIFSTDWTNGWTFLDSNFEKKYPQKKDIYFLLKSYYDYKITGKQCNIVDVKMLLREYSRWLYNNGYDKKPNSFNEFFNFDGNLPYFNFIAK